MNEMMVCEEPRSVSDTQYLIKDKSSSLSCPALCGEVRVNSHKWLSSTSFPFHALHILKHCVVKTAEEKHSVNNLPSCLGEIKNIFHRENKSQLLLGISRD